MLFSATLSPLGYYRSVLGGERSDETLEVNSPFAPEQLTVAIMDKISTRYSEREDDRGVIVLIDDRFDDPLYRKSLPKLWEGVKFVSDAKELKEELESFWRADADN